MKSTWVQPAISLIFALAFVYGFVRGLVDSKDFQYIAIAAILWWYNQKNKAP